MNLPTAAKFLMGDVTAIQQVARSRAAFRFGIVLVLTAGIARQYDQSFILEAPERWFLGSLLFSTVTGTILFTFFYVSFIRAYSDRDALNETSFGSQWRSFMTCYWMTAPLAWLYAIPVERLFDPLTAVQANFFLLATVAAWRVVLIARVCAVITEAPFIRIFPWILLFACAEFLIITFSSAAFGRTIMISMGGMENSPEESLLIRLASNTFVAAFWILVASIIWLIASATWLDELKAKPFPSATRDKFPTATALILLALFGLLAIKPQREQLHSHTLQTQFAAKNYRHALDYLSTNGLAAFAPSRPIPPKLYEYEMYEQMLGVFKALKAEDPQWLRDFYFQKLTTMFSIEPPFHFRDELPNTILEIFPAVKRLPGGAEWARQNRKSLFSFSEIFRRFDEDYGPKFDAAVNDLAGTPLLRPQSATESPSNNSSDSP